VNGIETPGVYVDRNRRCYIVVKKGRRYVHAVQMCAARLRVSRLTAHQIQARRLRPLDNYPLRAALAQFLERGRTAGITDRARRALEELRTNGNGRIRRRTGHSD